MILFPAIDLKDGKVSSPLRRRFCDVHQVAEDPLETAQAFFDAGARHIHMVDLDGAKDGVPAEQCHRPCSSGTLGPSCGAWGRYPLYG